MSSTANDLQRAILEGKQSLAQLLRQTKLVAAKLRLTDVGQWVDLELTGFPEDAEPPSYRKVLTNRLEIYNSHRDVWEFAGNLNYALEARQPLEEIKCLSRLEAVSFPVTKNFAIKNDFGDSFGSDWPQRFIVLGPEYQRVLEAVAGRWTDELERRGARVIDAGKLIAFLNTVSSA
jgi:hypothetical protein